MLTAQTYMLLNQIFFSVLGHLFCPLKLPLESRSELGNAEDVGTGKTSVTGAPIAQNMEGPMHFF